MSGASMDAARFLVVGFACLCGWLCLIRVVSWIDHQWTLYRWGKR